MQQSISPGQMKRLQVLYGQLCAHTCQGNDRESRLMWASQLVERPIESFKDLSMSDARHLIETLQGTLGIPETAASRRPRRRPRLDREAAQKAGTEGRRGYESNTATMASAAEFARIQYALDQLGWNQAQLEGWLRSTRSPLGKRANPKIVTLGDANRVWWALKRMIDRKSA